MGKSKPKRSRRPAFARTNRGEADGGDGEEASPAAELLEKVSRGGNGPRLFPSV